MRLTYSHQQRCTEMYRGMYRVTRRRGLVNLVIYFFIFNFDFDFIYFFRISGIRG